MRAEHLRWKVMLLTGAADGHVAVWNITAVLKEYHALAKQSEHYDVNPPIDLVPVAAAQASLKPPPFLPHDTRCFLLGASIGREHTQCLAKS